MRYHVLAVDYDGTLAREGIVAPATIEALMRLKRSGRKLVLVTGRQLPDLRDAFPDLSLCDRVVAENGALLYRPDTREEELLAEPPPRAFVRELQQRRVEVFPGRVIVATRRPHETAVLETIRDLGLELQLVFNKGAVMVLPSGVNKASGLRIALAELGLSLHNAVAVGDAENDHAFLSASECSIAVANALPTIRDYADWVTRGERGDGVVELIDKLLVSDLAELAPQLTRHDIVVGQCADNVAVRIRAYGENVLIAGTSGGGKSTFATAFVERLADKRYQFCVIDPEGDYQQIQSAIVIGDAVQPPTIQDTLELLEHPARNVAVNLLAIPRENRPAFFERLLPALSEMRARTGRPHWIVIDETHHLMPAAWERASMLPQSPHGLMMVTVHPDHVSPALLSAVHTIFAIGAEPVRTLTTFAAALGKAPPTVRYDPLGPGEAIAWSPARIPNEAIRFRAIQPQAERRRHLRKYAEGDLGSDRSFYFRGPDGRMRLRAQNLMFFLQLADGIDDDTWLHHLQHRDYSRWFREAIKDESLATAAEEVETEKELTARESRNRIRNAIEQRYIPPA